MVSLEAQLLDAFERHSVDGIRAALVAGASATAPIRGKLPIDWLVEMYTRSDRFPDCLRVLLDAGATWPDPLIAAVLLNDGDALRECIADDPGKVHRRVSLFSAFTPLTEVTVLHVAAEYGHLAAADVLLAAGADVNARAGIDGEGLGGHSAIFHTVNSNANRSVNVMRRFIEAGADCTLRVDGLVWGRDCDWETVCFDLTPISWAQLGLLPQMHRNEADTVANIRELLQAACRPVPIMRNVPNRYLKPDKS